MNAATSWFDRTAMLPGAATCSTWSPTSCWTSFPVASPPERRELPRPARKESTSRPYRHIMAHRYDNLIDGEWIAGDHYRQNINPANVDESVGEFASASATQ